MKEYIAVLSINALRLPVHLGVEASERERAQPVEVTAQLYFESLPECAEDDESDTFICYDVICSSLSNYVQGKEFRFIEYLCMDLYRVIRTHLEDQLGEEAAKAVKLWVKLHKCVAPVPYMTGGAHFIYSDFPVQPSAVAVE